MTIKNGAMAMASLVDRRFVHVALLATFSLLALSGLTAVSSAQQPGGGVVWEPSMRVPSPEETSSWFPDLAVDSEGRVHLVWCETNHKAMNYAQPGDDIDPSRFERVYYSMWDGQQWSPYNDIVPPQQDIIRNAIAVDRYDTLHLLFEFTPSVPGYGLYYKQASANAASSAAAWSFPRLVNGRNFTYMGDIAVFQDTLHIVYDDRGAERGVCRGCADIFYRHSTDRGRTWSAPVALFPTGTGSSRAQIEIDRTGAIHVAWDEGWDRLAGRSGDPEYGVYMYSADAGNTWSVPTVITYPVSTNVQLSVGSNGQGGVMLVWRTTSPEYPGIYYVWSTDQGQSWSSPQAIPNIVAVRWNDPFDLYDMATDSAGHIHLLVGGYVSTNLAAPPSDGSPHGLYHLEWDGDRWSFPAPVYRGSWYPMYPHLVVGGGNQLHATWFIREDLWKDETPHQVWYAHGQSQAPTETPVAPPTFTPSPQPTPTPKPISMSTAIPHPELNSGTSGLPEGLYTESDDVLRLTVALSPVVLLVLVIVAIKLGWFRRPG